jgi:hypothetical protein
MVTCLRHQATSSYQESATLATALSRCFDSAGKCFPSCYPATDIYSDFTIPIFGRNVTLSKKLRLTPFWECIINREWRRLLNHHKKGTKFYFQHRWEPKIAKLGISLKLKGFTSQGHLLKAMTDPQKHFTHEVLLKSHRRPDYNRGDHSGTLLDDVSKGSSKLLQAYISLYC